MTASPATDATASTNTLFGPDSPIMYPRSLNRVQNCADVAIPLIAAGGCRAVSAGVLARHFGVTPAAALKWFGTTARMWELLSDAISSRWCVYLDNTSRLATDTARAPAYSETDIHQAVSLFLPLTQDEIEWTRVWLALLELGRHQELAGACLARREAHELEVLCRATNCRDVPTLTTTMVVVRGLRHMVAATHSPLALDAAHELLRRHVTHTYVEHGIPEPASDEDVLPSTTRYTYHRG